MDRDAGGAAVRREPCACGLSICVAFDVDPFIEAAVSRHNLTLAHRVWRRKREVCVTNHLWHVRMRAEISAVRAERRDVTGVLTRLRGTVAA